MEPDLWGRDWSIGVRVWVERAGKALLGQGRLELLEGIDRWHSISEAARRMHMSYRRAWLLVQSTNEAAGAALVVAAPGGSRGGGAQLTELGRQAVSVFRELSGEIHRAATSTLPRLVKDAATVHVAAAVSLQEVLGQLLVDYALLRPTIRVRPVYGASDELAALVLRGAPADLFLTADPVPLSRLVEAGVVRPRSAVALAENGLAAVARPGWEETVESAADLTRPAVKRFALANPASPLGRYVRSYLEHVKLTESLRSRSLIVDNSRAVLAALRAGQADVGIIYHSDLQSAGDCRLLFPVPRLPRPIRYWAAVTNGAGEPGEARAFLDFLKSPAASRRLRRCGFFPLKRRSPK